MKLSRRTFIAAAALAPLAPRDLLADPWDPFQVLNTALERPYYVGVDHGSGDRTCAVALRYEAPRVVLVGTFERRDDEDDAAFSARVFAALGA